VKVDVGCREALGAGNSWQVDIRDIRTFLIFRSNENPVSVNFGAGELDAACAGIGGFVEAASMEPVRDIR